MEKKAEYQISSSVNEGILEIIETGEVTESEVEKLTNEVIAIIKANVVMNVLVDVRAIKGRFGYVEAYIRVRNYPLDISRANIAIVNLPENTDYEKYQEATALNAGLSWKCFTDIDAARAWLKSKQIKGSCSAGDNRNEDSVAQKEQNIVMEEKRKAERLEDVNEIVISIISGENNLPEEEICYSHCKDISVSGTRLRATIILPVDTILKVDFTLKDLQQKITTFGKVKWIKVIIDDQYYEAGLEFVDTPSEAIRRIEDYIEWKKRTSLNPI